MPHCMICNSRALQLAAGLALAVMAVAGCAHFKEASFSQERDAETARRLYEPIVSGREGLARVLAEVKAEPIAYGLTRDGVTPPDGQTEFWRENKLTFYRIAEKEGSPARLMYLSPRSLSLTDLGQDLPKGADLVQLTPDTFSVFRALHTGGHLHENIEIFRFDFSFANNQVQFQKPVRITQNEDFNDCPCPDAVAGNLKYILREPPKDGVSKGTLMVCGLDGADPKPVWADQPFSVEMLQPSPTGALMTAANPDGYFRLYTIGSAQDGAPTLEPLAEPPSALPSNTSVFLSSAAQDGALQPVLFELPAALDLDGALALVAAHNATINQRRAELASALVEVGLATLASWPTLTFGGSFEKDTQAFVNKPKLYPGDIFSLGLLQASLGFVQPLLDIPNNIAESKARECHADLLREVLNDEVNNRLTEAAEVYFEAQYLRQLVALEEHWINVARERKAYYDRMHSQGEAYRLQILAAQQVVDNLVPEHVFHQEQFAFLKKRLGHLCGIPENAELTLAEEQFRFQQYQPEPLQTVREIALLNHPRVAMVEHQLVEAYYGTETGAAIRPQLSLSGGFDLGERRYERPVSKSYDVGGGATVTTSSLETERRSEEHSNIGLSGSLPLASVKARRLDRESRGAAIQALQLEKEAAMRATATFIEEDYVDFHAAQEDYRAKMASVSYYLEQLRLARVIKATGLPGPLMELPALSQDLSSGGPRLKTARLVGEVSADTTVVSGHYLADITAEVELMSSLANLLEVEKDLGVRLAHLWREMGLSTRLTAEAKEWKMPQWQQKASSVWMWHTRDVIGNDESIDAFVSTAKAQNVHRVYAYLFNGDWLRDDITFREKFRHMLNACYSNNIEVWALFGEPEWLEGEGDLRSVVRAVEAVREFNGAQTAYEPKIAGVKFDLEPHSMPAWLGSEEERAHLTGVYMSLLTAARNALAGTVPLWVDCPVKFFKPEQRPLLDALTEQVDGATLMCYFDQENAILKNAGLALSAFGKPLEIGIEFGDKSPPEDRVSGWPAPRLTAFLQTLRTEAGKYPPFAGIAYHDYDSWAKYLREKAP